MPYREATKTDQWRALGYTLLTILAIVVTGLILAPLSWPVGLLVWLVIPVGSTFLLVRWHAHSTAYRCPACGQEFEIAVLTDLVSPHFRSRKYLRCPQCGKRGWATVLMRVDD